MEPHHRKGMDLASTSIMHVSKLTLSVLSVHAIKPNQCVLSDTFQVAHQQQAACKSEEDYFMLKGTTHKIEEETRMKAGIELPHGFRFHPTDEELVNYYLCRRCAGQPIAAPIIKEVDLYKFDPWHLPEIGFYGEKEWYFFSPRNRKYPNGSRPNRAAGSGYWKATGADKPIGKPKTLGIKKALVFYAGKAPNGVKTNWIMHEYRLANVDRYASKKNNNNLRLDDWVLCRIYNKKGKIEKYNIGAPKMNTEVVHNFEHENETKPEIHKLGNEELYLETSDSVPRFHTDSSSSEQMISPEREVESHPKRNDMGLQLENKFDFQFNYLDNNNLSLDDAFGTVQYQMGQQSLLEDMFMYLQKPF